MKSRFLITLLEIYFQPSIFQDWTMIDKKKYTYEIFRRKLSLVQVSLFLEWFQTNFLASRDFLFLKSVKCNCRD